MIPKKIHYCWFGRNPLPPLAVKCIESWKKYLPDYEIIEWNEDTFDVSMYQFTKEAYENKKYAFVSDVCRLYVLKQYGGIYMDTDVEVIKNLDDFLNHNAFSGFENIDLIPTGIMASEKAGAWITDMLDYYNNRSFILLNGSLDIKANTLIISELMSEKGILLNNSYQEISNYVTFYPKEYFCPKNYLTEKIELTENSFCIHHFASSWYPTHRKILKKTKKLSINLFGYENVKDIILFFKKVFPKKF